MSTSGNVCSLFLNENVSQVTGHALRTDLVLILLKASVFGSPSLDAGLKSLDLFVQLAFIFQVIIFKRFLRFVTSR
jgi:hypothetical protein